MIHQSVSKFLLIVMLISCSSKSRKQHAENQNGTYSKEVLKYLEIYDTDEDMKLYIEGKSYHIEDSLSKYLDKLSMDSLYCDEKFKSLMGNLVEKRYLSLIEIVPKQDITRSLTYNAVSWCYLRKSSQSFLNYISDIKWMPEDDFGRYSLPKKDFMCIDTVVLKLNNNMYLKTDSIHQVCMRLVRQKKTGGCLW